MKSMIVLFAGIALAGCATTYKDFKADQIKPNEGVVVGKVNIKYNGRNMNEQCGLCLNSVTAPVKS